MWVRTQRYSSVAASIRSPTALSMLRQYSKARSEHLVAAQPGQAVRHRVDQPVAGGVVHDLG